MLSVGLNKLLEGEFMILVFGGSAGGFAAAGTLAAYGALSGVEAGTALGPVGILVGGGIGLAGGLLAFAGQEAYKHRGDIKEGIDILYLPTISLKK